MKRWISFLGHLVIIVALTSFSVNTFTSDSSEFPEGVLRSENFMVKFPEIEANEFTTIDNSVLLGSDFNGFKEAVGFKESQGKYGSVNTLGYLGKYQFGRSTLKLMGVYNTNQFLNDPALQEQIFELNIARNKWILRRDIKRFVGKKINGTVISESGIVAAAHLAGAGNVKKYLRSYGKNDFMDAYGSDVASYIKTFGGYDISSIKPKRNAKI